MLSWRIFMGLRMKGHQWEQQALRRWLQDSCVWILNLFFFFFLLLINFFLYALIADCICVYNMQLSLWNVWAHQSVRSFHWQRNCQPLQQLHSRPFPPTTFSWICVKIHSQLVLFILGWQVESSLWKFLQTKVPEAKIVSSRRGLSYIIFFMFCFLLMLYSCPCAIFFFSGPCWWWFS